MTDLLRSKALEICRKHLGGGVYTVAPLKQGMMNHMFRVGTDLGYAVVVRIYPGSRAKVAVYEPEMVRRLRAAGMAVPEVIAHENGDGSAFSAYMLYRYIPGETLALRESSLGGREIRELAAALVIQLRLMADCSVTGFGGLIAADAADDPSPWDFFQRSVRGGVAAASDSGVLDTAAIDRLERILMRCESDVSKFNGSLAWGDLAPSNILLDERNRFAGLVDFESSFVFDRALSAGYFYAVNPDHPLLTALITESASEGFEIDPYRTKLCAVLRLARVAKYAHRGLPSGALQRSMSEMLPGAMRALHELAP
jgi:aminoglycoside phosphotransferase (APT) family kinase protein